MDIKRVVFRLTGEKSPTKINEALDYLYAWCLIEVGPKDALKALEEIHWLLEFSALRIVVRRLPDFFMGHVGPILVPMTRTAERELIMAVKLLGGIGLQAVIFEADARFFSELGKGR